MWRAVFSFVVAFVVIGSFPDVFGQGHTLMTPHLLEMTRKFTVYAPYPDYPASALGRHLHGDGIFLLHVRGDGSVSRMDILKSTGHRELDDACLSVYSQWRFRKDFAAKVHNVKMPVTFKA
jgi:TonB family protein